MEKENLSQEDTMCNHNLSFKEMNICKTGSYAIHTIKFNIKFFLAEQNFPSLKRDFLIFFKFYFLLLKELYQIKLVLVSWTPCWSPCFTNYRWCWQLTFEGIVSQELKWRSQDYLLFPLFHCFWFRPNHSYLSTKLPSSLLSFVLIL